MFNSASDTHADTACINTAKLTVLTEPSTTSTAAVEGAAAAVAAAAVAAAAVAVAVVISAAAGTEAVAMCSGMREPRTKR